MLYNLGYLEEISAGDKNFINEMLLDFVVNTPITLLEIKTQIDAHDFDEIYKVIHRFVPTFDYVGAESIKEKLRLIEDYAKKKDNFEQIQELYNEVKIESIELSEIIRKDFKIIA